MSQPAATAPHAPIADLSYRHYDGPLRTHPVRWWIIAVAGMRAVIKKWWFWTPAALAAGPYFISGLMLFLRSRAPKDMLDAAEAMGAPVRPISGFFYDAYHFSLFWIFILALLVGSASIAGDNRTNALQIYLSKPLTRLDYVAGKWAGVFLLLAGACLIPALVLFGYCLGTFQAQGFAREAWPLLLRILASTAITGALHASLILGISSWSKRPMMVAGIYAGLYTGLGIVMSIVWAIFLGSGHPHRAQTAAHLSLPGLLRGIAQHLYNATPTFFGNPAGGGGRGGGLITIKPDLLLVSLVAASLVIVGIAAAVSRVRAVEVVKG
jgi:ABC-2 type transport system permease protein